jgi:class 3 adenylate cyclase
VRCSRENPADARFCNGCGQPLRPEAPLAVREPAPRAYTPASLAERILTSRSALEGERKQVTVLFADLRGSMELLMNRDPEESRTLLDSVLELMMDAVHRYEGTVSRVLGDGIMALFGRRSPTKTTPSAPATLPWPCRRGCGGMRRRSSGPTGHWSRRGSG